MNILFVCTGNTCRSCMAEGILKNIIKSNAALNAVIHVESAGISAYDGDNASSNAVSVLKNEWAIDISKHHARSVRHEMVEAADLILTMTYGHKHALLSIYPGIAEKTYTLKEFAMDNPSENNMIDYGRALDIKDPYGMSEQVYKECAEEIRNAVNMVISKLEDKGMFPKPY